MAGNHCWWVFIFLATVCVLFQINKNVAPKGAAEVANVNMNGKENRNGLE